MYYGSYLWEVIYWTRKIPSTEPFATAVKLVAVAIFPPVGSEGFIEKQISRIWGNGLIIKTQNEMNQLFSAKLSLGNI